MRNLEAFPIVTEGDSSGPETAIANNPACVDPDSEIATLRARGADRFDPVEFRFIESLAERTASCPNAARPLLAGRLRRALADYSERLEQAEADAKTVLAEAAERFPEAEAALRQLSDNGDLAGLRRQLARLEARGRPGPLAALLDEIGRHALDVELKSVDRFRATWSRLALERQLSRAFAQAPDNAGPLNSEHLVLRSLGLMRDISPDYLASFMSWVDALFWLDQAAASPVLERKGGQDGVQGKEEKVRGGKKRTGGPREAPRSGARR